MGDEFPYVPGVEHRFLEVDGIEVHLAEAGPPEAPPVLLLHGFPQHWYLWRPLLERLGNEYRLLAPDLRGFGWTEAPGYGYDTETFAADQLALLDALGVERAAVIGHDWGGITAFILAIRHPGRVSALLSLNVPPPFSRLTARLVLEQWRTWYAALLASPVLGLRVVRSGAMPRLMFGRGLSAEEIEIYLSPLRQPERAAAAQALYRAYPRLARRVAGGVYRRMRLEVPARVLFGEKDLAISKELLRGHEPYADDLEIELVGDAGHFIVEQKPDLVLARVRELLAAHAPAGTAKTS